MVIIIVMTSIKSSGHLERMAGSTPDAVYSQR